MRKILPVILFLILCFNSSFVRAQENEGRLLAQGKYFSVYAEGNIDAYAVLSKLKFDYLVYQDTFDSGATENLTDILAKTVDGLFQEVSDILDIHVYSLKGAVKVLADQKALASLLKRDFNFDFDERSIYYHEKSTIYISLADLNIGILGHEMAHAIISNFFVVPPPVKVQEILCGYVEYSLRKIQAAK
jgi:hypothetical protein